ncbi:MAG: hypothetical protein KGI33_09140 [Thaumarchaeota archaeon]|nr:hypothetical protein [Nitrososphaerota archaeon]
MKTLHLAIITGTGISIIIATTILLIIPSNNGNHTMQGSPSQINTSVIGIAVNGLNDTYYVGHPIKFGIITNSTECSRPHVTLTNENGNVVWANRPDVMFCDIISSSWPTTWHWNLDSGDLGSLQVNETGTYKITISFFGKTLEKQFSVIPQENTALNLTNNTGTVTLGNQTYYFETPNYTSRVYLHPKQISFHDVIFTLFPNGFKGGLP